MRTRASFDKDLRKLQDELLVMGSMVEKAIFRALNALKDRDLAASRQVINDDDAIDAQRFKLEDMCIDLIATQQPIASDLRRIMVIMHLSSELERMGDYAEGIGKISLMMGEEPPIKPLIDIPRMAELATSMLRRGLDALVNRDVTLATQVCLDDDQVDALYDRVFHDLLVYMVNDSKTIQRATFLLWVAHDLERLADRATNIAEQVIYLVTGKMTEINTHKA